MTSTPQDRLRAFWDERYASSSYAYGIEPNTFLVEHVQPLKPGDAVLCLADGEGRNGVWLAGQGATVTSMDIAPVGLAKAEQLSRARGVALRTVAADVTTADLGTASWDLITSIFLHLPATRRRELHQRVLQALKPGGRFIYEAYGTGQAALPTGGPREAELLATLAGVASDFAQLPASAFLHRFQGMRTVREGALHSGDGEVVQLVIRKPVP